MDEGMDDELTCTYVCVTEVVIIGGWLKKKNKR